MSAPEERDEAIAQVAIRKTDGMFLRTAMADGTLPDGRKFDVSSAGALLVLCVYSAEEKSKGTTGKGGGTYTIDAREMIQAVLDAESGS